MTFVYRSIIVASLLAIPAAGALAQGATNNPGDSGGTNGSLIATPTYPKGEPSDPALSPGRLARETTGVPADENPNVPGATGMTIVPGDHSTVGGDRRATTREKTGFSSEGSND